jgi:hypothetical protein
MPSPHKTLLVVIMLAAALAGALYAWSVQRGAGVAPTVDKPGAQDASAVKTGQESKQSATLTASQPNTGATAPAATAAGGTAAAAKADDKVDKGKLPFDYGKNEPVPADLNPQVQSVAEALKTRTHPERLTAMLPPKPFNRAAYEADRRAYLEVVEPGRVFQAAAPGEGVRAIRATSDRHPLIKQGDKTALSVVVEPNMPVTYTSFDLGRFQENQLTSITVAADAQGVAKVHFVGSPGTIGEVSVLASCPVTSGQVRFLVQIER